MSGESGDLRWSPVQRVESVLLSVLSLLDDPNIDSPANVDASVMYRDKQDEYKNLVKRDLEASKKDIPVNFVMPTSEAFNSKNQDTDMFMDDDWADSDAELDFSGSDSDFGFDDALAEDEDESQDD